MNRKLQFAEWSMALGMGAALAVPCYAQGPRANWAQNRQDNKPPKQQSQPPARQQQPSQQSPPRQQQPPRQQPRQQGQEQRQERRQQQQETRRMPNERQNSGANRPPNSNMNRAETAMRPNNNPNRPPSTYTPPKTEFNNLSPQERQRGLG